MHDNIETIGVLPEFQAFPKMARLSRDCVISLKIDGTNAQVFIDDYGVIHAGSRTRWITPQSDNHGFARWVEGNKSSLLTLGPGRHFGEWMGGSIQRGYGIKEKRWYLFNSLHWIRQEEERIDAKQLVAPDCCHVVPILYRGLFTTEIVDATLSELREHGCAEFPGWDNHEGVVVYHVAAGVGFKKTLENDEHPKSLVI
jgi:hypothetical protein